ncbi:MAG: NAD(P)H-dependent oxidoreductase [Endomicrobium sp.]|jgi:chromate reductase|uniref:NADPH-dependent FMN reductase n=1 Tax=Candidatus Endomicrobiellum cubanum TaxID=3242325 RepID=UPI00281C6C27|nr:NAD(P)H-dependent oxidoreductase [Endomicrobium sp.]
MKIFVIIGGISKESINKKFFELIKPLAPSEFEFDTFDISQLPFFSQDLEEKEPEGVREFKRGIEKVEGIIFITPEYNRAIPGVLKNAIDWGSRPECKSVWRDKAACVVGASVGTTGAISAQMQLKETVSFLEMRVMYRPEVCFNFLEKVDKNGEIEEKGRERVVEFLNRFKGWILKNK